MLTKKDIKKFSLCTVTISGKGIETKTFDDLKAVERINTELQINMPKGYMTIYLEYPTKKDQNNFMIENDQVICKKGNMEIIFKS